jgi:hypothetical protein
MFKINFDYGRRGYEDSSEGTVARRGTAMLVMAIGILSAVLTAWAAVTYYATYKLDGGNATLTGQSFSANATDTSGIWVTNSGNLTLNNCTITTSGNTSSQENSGFYRLNADLLASASGKVTISGGSITTTGTGANGAFATGSGSSVTLSDVTIQASEDGGHGVMATSSATMNLTNVDMTTSGNQGGTLRVTFSELSSSSAGGVTVCTTTAVPSGKAGLAYAGIP